MKDADRLADLASRLDAALRELGKLLNPAAVHVNMLRGQIAKPYWPAIQHMYPEARALAAERSLAIDALEYAATRPSSRCLIWITAFIEEQAWAVRDFEEWRAQRPGLQTSKSE